MTNPSHPFICVTHRANHWGAAAKACQESLVAQGADGAALAIFYVSEAFAADLSSIVTFLRETTHVEHWVGAVVPGVLDDGDGPRDDGVLSVLAGDLPAHAFRCFAATADQVMAPDIAQWVAAQSSAVALIHGATMAATLPRLIVDAGDAAFLVGGLVSGLEPPVLAADKVTDAALSGIVLGDGIQILTGLTQGCAPLGPSHTITAMGENVVMDLDGRRALEVMKDDAGELIARDPRRAAGFIHAALPVRGSDTGDYVVRSLMGIDPVRGWLMVGGEARQGDQMIFVRRDANTARLDMTRMLDDLDRRLGGRRILAAHYTACTARGRHMFGHDGAELAMIRDRWPGIPIIGHFANGEISAGRLYTFTGVLTLIVGDGS